MPNVPTKLLALAAVALSMLVVACGSSSTQLASGSPGDNIPPSLDTHCDASRATVAFHASGVPADVAPLIPCRYGTGMRAMEPSFAFARDGRILYQGWVLNDGAPGGLPPTPHVARSSDGGATWQDITPIGPLLTLDPFMLLDEYTGRIFTLTFLADVEPLGATLQYTDDGGDTWTTSPLAGYGFDGESLGAGPPVTSATLGYPDLVYYCTGTTPGSGPPTTTPICSKSLDGGVTFIPTGGLPYPVHGEQNVFAPWAGNPIVAPDGTLYLPKRHDSQPQIAISHDEGMTWTHLAVASNGSSSQATRATVDAAGNVYYTWTADDHLPYLAYSRDSGQSWSAPIRLNPPDVIEAALPRVAVSTPGKVAVAYLGSSDAPGAPPYYASCNVLLAMCTDANYDGVTWNGYLAQVDDLFAADPVIRTATVNDASHPLFVGGCSAEAACKADLDFIDVHFDAGGFAWGAFVDDCEWTRGFTPIFTLDTPPCGDGVGEGILGKLLPAT